MSAPGRNRPCPCGSGAKYKKCCGADEPVQRDGALKPRYAPGDERAPAYWRALKKARNRFAFPRVAWEDPRTTAAMLGLPQRPGFDARRPPLDEDFDYLLVSETIDEQMASVLQRKRAVIDAVTDGRQVAETSALDAVVQALRERPVGAALRAAA